MPKRQMIIESGIASSPADPAGGGRILVGAAKSVFNVGYFCKLQNQNNGPFRKDCHYLFVGKILDIED